MRLPSMAPLVAALALASAAGCTTDNQFFCNSETPCDPDSERPYCDFAGEFGPSNTCIAAPVDGGARPDVDPLAPDAGPDAAPPTFCESEAAPDCNDGIACTDDACDDDSEDCTHLPNHDNCGGATPFCHPTLGCVAQTCSGPEDCDDEVFCNGAEVCDIPSGDTVGTCRAGADPDCGDTVGCTADSCNVATDSCANVPDHDECDDGVFCNGAELCDAVTGCGAGTPPALSDGVGCTTDTCNETTDSIDHVPNNAMCDDGKFCNGNEVCSATMGCLDGTPPALSDGVGCTVDSCNESLDVIQHVANHSVCDDGKFCNGDEVCHTTLDCQSGTPPALSDGVGCTVDSCDEINDEIDHVPDDALCVDSLYCNGTEMCSPTVDCVAGSPVDCSPHPVCHVSNSCSEALDDCNPTMAKLDFTWQIFGSAGGSGDPTECGSYDVVFTNSNACDATHGFEYRCQFDGEGRIGAFVAATGGFSIGCLGFAGEYKASGCSEVTNYVPEFDAYEIFKCCQ